MFHIRFHALVLVLAASVSFLQANTGKGQEEQAQILVTNRSSTTVSYRYRAIYNDGNGSAERYFSVRHADDETLELKAAGVPLYGIVVRLPGDGTEWGRKLYAHLGPYELRAGQNPL